MYSKIIDFLPEALIEFEYDDILPHNADGKKSTIQDLRDRLLKVEAKNINPAALKLLGAGSSIDIKRKQA
ncbi:MAG: hypothetical protein U5N58_08245 [Actinomycetota bacterium]|nr:hypothetical protein [Actinomycetota bacterium]